MEPPSSLFLTVVAIVILVFAVLSFVSAVDYKNVANNEVEAQSLSTDTANSFTIVMIIVGIVMLVVFVWMAYVVFTYKDEKSLVDKRDVSLLAEAKHSIERFKDVRSAYKNLQKQLDDTKANFNKKLNDVNKWDYCPSPKIKLEIKPDTGKVVGKEYDKDGNIKALIIKPEPVDPNAKDCKSYKAIDFVMETQKCYDIEENKRFNMFNNPGMSQTLGPMTQTLGNFPTSNFIPGMKSNSNINPNLFQTTNPLLENKSCNTKDNSKGFLCKKSIPMPGISFGGGCKKSNVNPGDVNMPMMPMMSSPYSYSIPICNN